MVKREGTLRQGCSGVRKRGSKKQRRIRRDRILMDICKVFKVPGVKLIKTIVANSTKICIILKKQEWKWR